MPRLDCENALDFARVMFIAAGVPPTEAQRVATSLVDANLCGHDSHGIIRVVQYIKAIEAGILKPGAPFVLLSETPSAVAADGNWNLGQVQAYRLLEKLIAKASVTGVAAGSLKQCGLIGPSSRVEAADALGLRGPSMGHALGIVFQKTQQPSGHQAGGKAVFSLHTSLNIRQVGWIANLQAAVQLRHVLRLFEAVHAWCQKGVPNTGVLAWAVSWGCIAPDR